MGAPAGGSGGFSVWSCPPPAGADCPPPNGREEDDDVEELGTDAVCGAGGLGGVGAGCMGAGGLCPGSDSSTALSHVAILLRCLSLLTWLQSATFGVPYEFAHAWHTHPGHCMSHE